ncbi:MULTISPECIES: SMI1/KNR4 family protein [Pseudomonas]|uniref:SMI1/KNR4 family protein n=1 Tax=Pseudomonas quercus TaxID=2722792 RepID=A0ABX0YEA1_9PSED|nr:MULTISPECIES: SMI1/KNR4 family protein [Pseudomonas]MBF7142717.1 hypothetical protein [Pseudomonas sp. LY10J]NJP01255.1 hypothetical protein [Pseudomonas quercus]
MNTEEIVQQFKADFAGKDVYLSLSELPQGLVIPEGWEGFGIRGTEPPRFPDAWHLFKNEFPWVTSLLDVGLLGTAILKDNTVNLIYVFHDSNGLYYYVGGAPISATPKEKMLSEFGIQGRLADFYNSVHDGFTFYAARSMGPAALEDMFFISDGMDEEDTEFAEGWLALFSNGGGDYIALDIDSTAKNNGLIWWHEEPFTPERDMDIFETMDTWMSIFLEDTKLRGPGNSQ